MIKALSIILAILMIATAIPFAFAADDCSHESYTNGICDNCEAECEHPENELVWTEQLAATCVPGNETAVCGFCGYVQCACTDSVYSRGVMPVACLKWREK